MNLSDINPSKKLKEAIDMLGLKIQVYANGEMPSSAKSDVFIQISNNGSLRTNSSQFGFLEQTLLLCIYVKLSSTDIKNTAKETMYLSKIETLIGSVLVLDSYTFQFDKLNIFGDAKNISSGYSTKLVNIKTTIKK
ncbi:MAG: hypothetical protein RR513_06580 [Muribaculaceae bacterium]